MAVSNLVIGTLMGLVLFVIAGVINGLRGWRREGPVEESPGAALVGFLRTPAAWMIAFVAVTLGAGIVAVAFVGGVSLPAIDQNAAGLVLLLVFGALIVFFVFVGIYASARSRGAGSAPAVGIGSAVIGLLVIAAVVVKLLLG